LKNPPIVAPFNDGSGNYMVLDGANRSTALKKMGLKHVLAQIVEPDALPLDVQTWNHVCWGISPDEFFAGLQAIPEIRLDKVDPTDGLRQLYSHHILIMAQRPDSEHSFAGLYDQGDLISRINLLHRVMDSYKERAKLDRTRVRQINAVKGMYEGLSGLIIYPPFKMNEVMQLVSAGHLFPAGVTRFTVAPRALRVNYPMDELDSEDSLEAKNERLDQWIQQKISAKSVRFYAEPTVLFDE
jgi:hypothetical protein